MATKCLYFPFTDISRDSTMPQNRARYESKYGGGLKVRFKGDPLHDVKDDEMLIIGGHGLPDSSKIGVSVDAGVTILGVQVRSPTMVTMTANDLAAELAAAGLPTTHKYIKLITCGGAGIVAVDDKRATIANGRVTGLPVARHNHVAECLGSVLAKALGQRHYEDILVKAYPGFVNGTQNDKMLVVEGTSELSQKSGWLSYVTGTVDRGMSSWKGGTVGMLGNVPTKIMNDYWFDKNGNLQRQHIRLKNP